MSGSVWPQSWMAAIGRSLLDLPLDREKSILGHWMDEVVALSEDIGAEGLSLRVTLCHTAPIPTASGNWSRNGTPIQVERDRLDYRGTGGALRDVAIHYDENDYLLVASAAQVLQESLISLAHSLARTGGDVVMLAHADGTPGSLMLVRCGVLSRIAPIGFVDFKEQALPEITGHHRVNVLRRPHAAILPVRTASDYLAAVRLHHRVRSNGLTIPNSVSDEHPSRFRVVEAKARIDHSAVLHDTVVLMGATVGADAILVRSIVCEGAVVQKGQVLVNQVLTRYGRWVPAEHRDFREQFRKNR